MKILIRKCRFLLGPYLRKRYKAILSEIPTEIDEVFIIKGEAITPTVLRWMKARFRRARFQIYLWDSLQNSPGSMALVPLMDRVFTFDLGDAKSHPQWHFLPNFYVSTKLVLDNSPRWNLAFIGTVHSDRLKIIAKISRSLPQPLTFYRFLYFQSPLLYRARQILDRNFKKFNKDELSLKPKLGDDWRKIASSTVAMLDIHHPKQTGCSHRAIECLAMGMKLVTTNESIREYPFYDERLIRIIDRDNPHVDSAFLKSRANVHAPQAISNLEITHWLDTIFQ